MVKAALQIPEWYQIEDKCMHVSPGKQVVRILLSSCDEGKAGKVLFTNVPVSQLPLTVEHKELLKQVASQVWSQHKTHLGFVISAQPI